jgi:hypothetical protein
MLIPALQICMDFRYNQGFYYIKHSLWLSLGNHLHMKWLSKYLLENVGAFYSRMREMHIVCAYPCFLNMHGFSGRHIIIMLISLLYKYAWIFGMIVAFTILTIAYGYHCVNHMLMKWLSKYLCAFYSGMREMHYVRAYPFEYAWISREMYNICAYLCFMNMHGFLVNAIFTILTITYG